MFLLLDWYIIQQPRIFWFYRRKCYLAMNVCKLKVRVVFLSAKKCRERQFDKPCSLQVCFVYLCSFDRTILSVQMFAICSVVVSFSFLGV